MLVLNNSINYRHHRFKKVSFNQSKSCVHHERQNVNTKSVVVVVSTKAHRRRKKIIIEATTVTNEERSDSNVNNNQKATTTKTTKEKQAMKGNPFEQTVKAAEERQELFNDIAPVYDQLNDILSLGLHRAWKLATVKWSGAKTGDVVLDVCCGSGDITKRLSDKVGETGMVYGLDFAENQLRRAKEKMDDLLLMTNFNPNNTNNTNNTNNDSSAAKITWVQGDALELPFEDDTFDAITMGYGLRNVRDIPKALSELKRVAKSGKKVAILDFNNSRDETTNQVSGFILDNVVVPFAKLNDVEAEYKYLRPSIERFPTGPELVDLALTAGFKEATHYELQPGGLMGCLVCEV